MSFERIEPDTPEWEAYYANHIQRYQFAAKELLARQPRNVLDAACGVGYGSHYLAKQGIDRVTAVDRDAHALQIAAQRFAHSGITFLQDDCHTLAKAAERGPFAAIVSFETLEHLPKPVDFLASCHSVLEPGGVLIMSTPNRPVSSADGPVAWHFHEQEYTAPEFVDLLTKAGFRELRLFGQQMTALGQLRQDARAEINLLRSNPFVRAGRWLQQALRGASAFAPPLPERVQDFEIVSIASPEECDAMGRSGPFVLIAVGKS